MKLAGKIIKYVLIGAACAVVAFLIWRILLINSDYVLGNVTPTENAKAAYALSGEDAFKSHYLPDRISGNDTEADGFFSAHTFVYIPEKKEVQITLRINDSTSERLGLGKELPYFFLKFNENGEDTGEVREYSSIEEEHELMYSYIRLVFEDVEITPETNLIVCLSTTGDSTASISELVIHFQEQVFEEYDLSRKEKKSLGNGD